MDIGKMKTDDEKEDRNEVWKVIIVIIIMWIVFIFL